MEKELKKLISEVVSENGDGEKTRQVITVFLTQLMSEFRQFQQELPPALVEIAKAVKVEIPEEQKVRVVNSDDLRSTLKFPEKIKIDTKSLEGLSDLLTQIKEVIKNSKKELSLPTDAKNPIAVRLSDGEKFIEQLTQVIHQAQTTGGGSVPKVTLAGGIQAVPIVNPDGTNLSLSAGDISGVSAYSDSGATDKKGLVDGDRHVQVDVLTAPTTAVTGTFWQATQPVSGTVTANATLTAETTKVIGTVNIAAAQTLATVTTVGAVTAITNALPAGTNGIGKLTANSGVDIGDVTLTAGTASIGSVLPPDTDVTAHTNYAKKYYTNAGAVTDGIIWSPAAGKRWHVVSLFVQTSAASTVTLEDDLGAGDSPVLKMELAANSGTVIPFPEHYPLASGEDAADLIITTTAGNVYVTVVGYEI